MPGSPRAQFPDLFLAGCHLGACPLWRVPAVLPACLCHVHAFLIAQGLAQHAYMRHVIPFFFVLGYLGRICPWKMHPQCLSLLGTFWVIWNPVDGTRAFHACHGLQPQTVTCPHAGPETDSITIAKTAHAFKAVLRLPAGKCRWQNPFANMPAFRYNGDRQILEGKGRCRQ